VPAQPIANVKTSQIHFFIRTAYYDSYHLSRPKCNNTLAHLKIFEPSGAYEVYRYAIEGKSYVTERQVYDKNAKLVLFERLHADGTLDLRDIRSPDGTRTYEVYDVSGKLISRTVTKI